MTVSWNGPQRARGAALNNLPLGARSVLVLGSREPRSRDPVECARDGFATLERLLKIPIQGVDGDGRPGPAINGSFDVARIRSALCNASPRNMTVRREVKWKT